MFKITESLENEERLDPVIFCINKYVNSLKITAINELKFQGIINRE